MEYFRKYLIWIRKQDNQGNLKPTFASRLSIFIIVGVVLGIVLDVTIPFNFGFNMIRGVIANIVGISGASLILIMAARNKRKKLQNDSYYLPVRKRFSYKQRINFSIIIGAIVALFILLSNKVSPIYTLKSAIAILVAILLVSFSRRDRSEFLKNIYDIPDVRDLEFMNKQANKENQDNSTINVKKRDKKV